MDEVTRAQLFQLGMAAKKAGLDRALKWLMARMAEDEESEKQRHSKRKVAVGHIHGPQSEFYVNSELLRNAVEKQADEEA